MVFSTLNQSFAFHASPETFISARLQELSRCELNPLPQTSASRKQPIVQASVLNRKVHIISSYRLCTEVLQTSTCPEQGRSESGGSEGKIDAETPLFAVGPAYKELMADWFPPPNILLQDGKQHWEHKEQWASQLSTLPLDATPLIRELTRTLIRQSFFPGSVLDLYETLKTFSWNLLMGTFLGLDRGGREKEFLAIIHAQEALLRGQFSLFPLAVNIPFWQSSRSKGLKARKDLQSLLRDHVDSADRTTCPFMRQAQVEKDDVASHCLLFTSSIVNKALTSLLTATLTNLFLMPREMSLANLVRSHNGEPRKSLLRSVLLETERLSPPVVGVMRRVQRDIDLELFCDGSRIKHHAQAGSDVWLYLAGANRDPMEYRNPDRFELDRFMREELSPAFTFGSGTKACLGREFVRHAVQAVTEEMVEAGIQLEGKIEAPGVRGWLGWEVISGLNDFAKDMKQLPCQRPRDPIEVTVRSTRGSVSSKV